MANSDRRKNGSVGARPLRQKNFVTLEGTAPAVPKKKFCSLEGTPPGVPKFFGRAGTKLEGNVPALPNLFKISVVQERNRRAALLSSRMFQNFGRAGARPSS
jgi:hypothetical protein